MARLFHEGFFVFAIEGDVNHGVRRSRGLLFVDLSACDWKNCVSFCFEFLIMVRLIVLLMLL